MNGDGFGVGWYPLHNDFEPGVFVSVRPAWNDRNFSNLCTKLVSHCFFAHVRSTSNVFSVSESNCHPFRWGNLLWMHNGRIGGFPKIKKIIANSLSDKAFNHIVGTTDSEYAFAIFLDEIGFNVSLSRYEMVNSLLCTIKKLVDFQTKNGVTENSNMNFAVTDGKRVVVSRYSTCDEDSGKSLYYKNSGLEKNSLLVASEPISNISDWLEVPKNHLICKDFYGDILLKKIISGE